MKLVTRVKHYIFNYLPLLFKSNFSESDISLHWRIKSSVATTAARIENWIKRFTLRMATIMSATKNVFHFIPCFLASLPVEKSLQFISPRSQYIPPCTQSSCSETGSWNHNFLLNLIISCSIVNIKALIINFIAVFKHPGLVINGSKNDTPPIKTMYFAGWTDGWMIFNDKIKDFKRIMP